MPDLSQATPEKPKPKYHAPRPIDQLPDLDEGRARSWPHYIALWIYAIVYRIARRILILCAQGFAAYVLWQTLVHLIKPFIRH